MARILVASGASLRLTDHHGLTPVHHVILGHTPQTSSSTTLIQQRLELLMHLVEEGCPVNQVDHTGRTPFSAALGRFTSLAATSIYLPLFETLLKLGADPNVRNSAGEQVLHRYCEKKHLPLILLCIAYGADVNGRDRLGRTPLFRATDLETVEALVAGGADVNALDNDGRTAFHHSIPRIPDEKVRQAEMIYLLQHGADPHIVDFTGESASELLQRPQFQDKASTLAVRTLIAALDARRVMRTAAVSRTPSPEP